VLDLQIIRKLLFLAKLFLENAFIILFHENISKYLFEFRCLHLIKSFGLFLENFKVGIPFQFMPRLYLNHLKQMILVQYFQLCIKKN